LANTDLRDKTDISFLGILRSPTSRRPFRVDGDYLVSSDGERFPVNYGIPVLLEAAAYTEVVGVTEVESHPCVSVPSSVPPASLQGQDEAIVRAFRRRATTYYRDNYGKAGNPAREARRVLVQSLLRGCVSATDFVLEAGAGPLVLSSDIRAITPNYIAVDLSLDNLVAGIQRVGSAMCVCASITALPFADGMFDVVTAVGCLEYITDVGLAVQELSRVSKPGGLVIMTFPNRRSPARWWDETIVHPLVRRRDIRRGDAVYRRALSSISDVSRLLDNADGMISEIHYINQGLLGYPLSSGEWSRRAWSLLTGRFPSLEGASSEIVVVARVRAR
jgi:SAM-dependent methyltransferase